MTNDSISYGAQSYYSRHYEGPSEADWRIWFDQGAWPSQRQRAGKLSEFDLSEEHGVVYRMLDPYAPFKKVLDIGCSAGDFLVPLRNVATEAYGVDIANFPGAWDVLNAEYGIRYQCLNIDETDLPFPDKHFSLVTMCATLEHVFDCIHAAQEIARVLEPGGLAVIQVPNIAYVKRRLSLLAGNLPITADAEDANFNRAWDGQHLHYFTLATLKKLFARFGCETIEARCFGRLASTRSLWPSLLGADLTVLLRRNG